MPHHQPRHTNKSLLAAALLGAEHCTRLIPARAAAIPRAWSSLPSPAAPCSTSCCLPGQPWARARILLLLLITPPLNGPTYQLAPAQPCCTGSPRLLCLETWPLAQADNSQHRMKTWCLMWSRAPSAPPQGPRQQQKAPQSKGGLIKLGELLRSGFGHGFSQLGAY